MRKKFIAYLALAFLFPGVALAQESLSKAKRVPDDVFKAEPEKVFDVALHYALENYVITYINDKHLLFTFQDNLTMAPESAIQQVVALSVKYSFHVEPNGNDGARVFVNSSMGNESLGSDEFLDLLDYRFKGKCNHGALLDCEGSEKPTKAATAGSSTANPRRSSASSKNKSN